jgi:hypothetical protein
MVKFRVILKAKAVKLREETLCNPPAGRLCGKTKNKTQSYNNGIATN